MKVSTISQHRKRAQVSIGTAVGKVDLAPRIAKAAAYLDRTSAQFAANVQKAKQHLNEFEGGVMAGPIARR